MVSNADVERALTEARLTPATAIVRRLEDSGSVSEAVAGDPDMDVYPASMLKTPLCAAALALVDQGILSLESRHPVEQLNMTVNDKPSHLVPGYVAHLSELIELAITRSDNVATNMLYDIVGRDRATAVCRDRFGLSNTRFCRKLSGAYPLIHDREWDGVHMNRHSARDAASLFESVARSHLPFALLLGETLTRQEWNNKLSRGLEAGDRFAHKTGDTDEVTHDGGMLSTASGSQYIVVVYTGMPSSDDHNARFAEFMQAIRCLM